ncbi:MAG: GGDEF domain-containing protein [Hyphomicrobiales bacterium]|nr:MAG: GGDEF domain-containing protein [Hyphomicrobiales bacterium]
MLALAPLAVASMNSARNELLRKLNFAADHDHLTGVLTRGALVTAASKLLANERRGSKGVALLMLDLDHFKSINDRHGHLIGDDVLVAFANAARAELRATDLLGRFGGEEFVALLPDTDRRAAVMIAERLRSP